MHVSSAKLLSMSVRSNTGIQRTVVPERQGDAPNEIMPLRPVEAGANGRETQLRGEQEQVRPEERRENEEDGAGQNGDAHVGGA